MVATVLAVQFTEKLQRRLRAIIRGSLVLVTVFPAVLTMTFWSLRTKALSHLVGATSRNTYLREHFLPEVRVHERLAEFTNRSLAADDRILMIFEARGLYLEPRVIEDTKVTNWALLSSRVGSGQCLGKSGITHVLANQGSAMYYAARGVPAEVLRWDEFERFTKSCLTPIYTDSGLTLYRVAVLALRHPFSSDHYAIESGSLPANESPGRAAQATSPVPRRVRRNGRCIHRNGSATAAVAHPSELGG
jgi:hypothetical protein